MLCVACLTLLRHLVEGNNRKQWDGKLQVSLRFSAAPWSTVASLFTCGLCNRDQPASQSFGLLIMSLLYFVGRWPSMHNFSINFIGFVACSCYFSSLYLGELTRFYKLYVNPQSDVLFYGGGGSVIYLILFVTNLYTELFFVYYYTCGYMTSSWTHTHYVLKWSFFGIYTVYSV